MQDVSFKDKLTIFLRYVKAGVVHEYLHRLLSVEGSSATINLHNALPKAFQSDGLEMENVVGESFDGASNMSGVHSGLQPEIRKVSPESVYIHCYAHVLDLVMKRVTTDLNEPRQLFGLISSVANFINQ